MGGLLDLIFVGCAIAAAAAHLVWSLALARRPPACERSGQRLPAQAVDVVVVGAGLARGMERARLRAQTGAAPPSGKGCCA